MFQPIIFHCQNERECPCVYIIILIILYFQTTFVLLLGPFVFFNIQKTKYLQLLTSAMRWLAFTIMIVYALKNIFLYGPRGDPPVANVAGKFSNCDFYPLQCY